MKIALVIERMVPARGGAERSTWQLACKLAEAGVNVEIVAGTAEPGLDGPRVQRLEPNPHRTRIPIRRFRRLLDVFLASNRYDLVHSVTPCLGGDVYQPRAGCLAENIDRRLAAIENPFKRRVHRLTGAFNSKQRMLLRLEREHLCGQGRRRVAALSEYVARQFRQRYDFPESRIQVIPNGIELAVPSDEKRAELRDRIRRLYTVGPDELLILFCAHNFQLKGLLPALGACELLKQRAPDLPFRVLVVGNRMPGRYAGDARKAGLRDRVIFTGPVGDMVPVYAAVDLTLHPTFYDAASRVVLESLAMGIPAVSTRYNGTSERIEPGVTGEVLGDPNDVDALCRALQQFVPAEARRTARKKAHKLQQQFSLDRHVEALLKLYRSISVDCRFDRNDRLPQKKRLKSCQLKRNYDET